MSQSEEQFFAEVAARNLVRPSVRAIILQDDHVLVQRPVDAATTSNYAFIGGEYEVEDTIESRLRRELEEETTAQLVSWRYLFVVENLFVHAGHRVHALEHYVLATIDNSTVESREEHLVQEWLPLTTLDTADLRPHVVRDVLVEGRQEHVRHMITDGWAASERHPSVPKREAVRLGHGTSWGDPALDAERDEDDLAAAEEDLRAQG